jgi:hypothetical protein
MDEVVARWSDKPFRYGMADCCQFVGECVESITGDNPMRHFAYDGEQAAYKLIDEFGSLSNGITATIGPPTNEPPQQGDVVVVMTDGRQMAGVVYRDMIIARTKNGVIDCPIECAETVWRPSCRR